MKYSWFDWSFRSSRAARSGHGSGIMPSARTSCYEDERRSATCSEPYGRERRGRVGHRVFCVFCGFFWFPKIL